MGGDMGLALKVVISGCALLGLGACSNVSSERPPPPIAISIRPANPNDLLPPEHLTAAGQALRDAPDLQAAMTGMTVRLYHGGHGNHVFYYGSDGTAYLWYPGNSHALQTRWSVEPTPPGSPASHKLCYIYPKSSNPVSRRVYQDGDKECESTAGFFSQTQESMPGDVLRLASGAVPFVLQAKARFTLADGVQALPSKP